MWSSPVDNPYADSPTQMISYITEFEQRMKNPKQTKKPKPLFCSLKHPKEPSSTGEGIADMEAGSGIWFFLSI